MFGYDIFLDTVEFCALFTKLTKVLINSSIGFQKTVISKITLILCIIVFILLQCSNLAIVLLI